MNLRFEYLWGLIMLVPSMLMGQVPDGVRRDIENLLKPIGGTFAVAFESQDGDGSLFINEKVMFHAASTMKTPVMIEVFKQAREGRFSLDDSLLVKNEFRSIVDGSSYQLDAKDDSDDWMYKQIGSMIAIRELVRRMITVSSNLATNILIEFVGVTNISKTLQALGAHDLVVLRGVEDGKAFEKGLNNRTNAYDLLILMRKIASLQAVDSLASEEMIAILSDQKFNDLIPALLPPGVNVAHKTGNITGVEHDSGIVFLPDGRSYVLVILSKELTDAEQGKKAIAAISKRLFDFVTLGK